MNSRLALAIEWDHVSKTKTKQRTSRKLSPSPSLHPQRSSFNPLYQDLALCLLSLQVFPIFFVTPIRYRPSTHYPLKTRKLPRFQSFWALTRGYKWKPHIRAYVPSHGGIENYTKWHLCCLCEVWVKCKFLCSDQGSVPNSFHVVHSNTATSKKNMKFKTHLGSSLSDKGYSVCITGHHVVLDSCRGLCVACCKSWNLVMEECFWAHPAFLPARAVLRLAAASLSKLSFSVAAPVYLFCDR